MLWGSLRMRSQARGIRSTEHAQCLPIPIHLPHTMSGLLVSILPCPRVKNGIFVCPYCTLGPTVSPGCVNHIYMYIIIYTHSMIHSIPLLHICINHTSMQMQGKKFQELRTSVHESTFAKVQQNCYIKFEILRLHNHSYIL